MLASKIAEICYSALNIDGNQQMLGNTRHINILGKYHRGNIQHGTDENDEVQVKCVNLGLFPVMAESS